MESKVSVQEVSLLTADLAARSRSEVQRRSFQLSGRHHRTAWCA